jgi:hypothetical protein
MQTYTATEIQSMVRNMDDSKRRWRLLKAQNNDEYEQKVAGENPILFEHFFTIYKKHLNDELDDTFFYMLQQKRRIEKGEITDDQAATAVGQKLFDRWVAPIVSNVPVQETPVQTYEQYYKNLSGLSS